MLKSLKRLFGNSEENKNESQESNLIAAPVSGQLIPMSQVNDPTFSQEILGKGVAIIPEEEEIKSPVNGTVTMVFDTKHAIGLKGDNGAELIIHIGLNTVELNGEYFTALIKEGQKVKVGTPLIRFEKDKIREKGYDTVTMVLVTNTPEFPDMVCKAGMDVKAGDVVIEL